VSVERSANPSAPSVTSVIAKRRWAILAVLCVSLLVISLDSTILNIALPSLIKDLHATESQLQWIVDVYSCVFAGVLLVAGSIGDRVGRKKILCAGLVIFGAGSAASAFSTSPTALDWARAAMGLGAACIMPATLSIITDVFRDPDDQERAIGIWSGTTGLGIAIGPIAGGWLLAHFWWGSIFLVNVPVVLLGLVAALWLVPDSRDPVRRPIDVLGAVASTAGLTLLVWSIIEVPQRGWRSPWVVGAGVLAVAILAGFVAWEHHSAHPMLVLEPFRDRRFSVAMAAVALAVFALMGSLFVLTQYLQFSLGFSPLATGVRILPIAVVLAVAATTSTTLVRWLGTKVVVASGLLIVVAGLWRLATTATAGGFGHAMVGMVLLGLGAGLIIAPSVASVMGSLPRERAGVGSATNSTALQVGGAMGVAVMGSVLSARYQGRMTSLLAGHQLPASASRAILGSIGGALSVARIASGGLGAALAAAARSAYVAGMDLALLVGAVVVAASAVLVVVALPARRRQDPADAVQGPTGTGSPMRGAGGPTAASATGVAASDGTAGTTS
jgi:EmrB/QacA subfamily drug resistance transporter